jgi:hypothetical protein
VPSYHSPRHGPNGLTRFEASRQTSPLTHKTVTGLKSPHPVNCTTRYCPAVSSFRLVLFDLFKALRASATRGKHVTPLLQLHAATKTGPRYLPTVLRTSMSHPDEGSPSLQTTGLASAGLPSSIAKICQRLEGARQGLETRSASLIRLRHALHRQSPRFIGHALWSATSALLAVSMPR